MAVIVQPGYHDTFDILKREFGPRGIPVFWDRRRGDRRKRVTPIAGERRHFVRRQNHTNWNVLHFCVVPMSDDVKPRDS